MDIWSRSDFTLTRATLAVVAVLAPVLLVGLPAVDWLRGDPLTWTGDTGSTAGLGALVDAAPGASLTWDGEAQVRITDASGGLWLAVLAPAALLALAASAVALLVRHVVGQTEVGRPFTEASLRSLRATGLLVVAASVVVPIGHGLVDAAVMEAALDDDRSMLSLQVSPLWLLGGLVVHALAEAFRAGADLAADVDGLV